LGSRDFVRYSSNHNTGIVDWFADCLTMEHQDKPLVRAAVWQKLSNSDKSKLRQLSVQYKANKSAAANRVRNRQKGVSLEMLAQAGLLGADTDNESCSKWISDLVDTQMDVVSFVQSIPPLHSRVVSISDGLKHAVTEGHFAAFGEENTRQLIQLFDGLASGLDVYSHCPMLAPEHVPVPPAAPGR
jgi:hypothetical protein